LMEVLAGVLEGIRTLQAQRIQDHVSRLIHDKSMNVDLALGRSCRTGSRSSPSGVCWCRTAGGSPWSS
jgi:hypothetical protein